MHIPSSNDRLRLYKETKNKITLNVSKCKAFIGEILNSEFCFNTSMRTGNVLYGDMKKNLIKGISLESV